MDLHVLVGMGAVTLKQQWCGHGCIETVEALVVHGADVNAESDAVCFPISTLWIVWPQQSSQACPICHIRHVTIASRPAGF